MKSESYDYILIDQYVMMSSMLNLDGHTNNPITVWNRITILFAELHRVLKPYGYIVIHVDTIETCEQFRVALKTCNYLSSVKIHQGTSGFMAEKTSYSVMAVKKAIDNVDKRDSIAIRDNVAANLVELNISNIISSNECYKIWLQFIFINIFIFAAFVFIATYYFQSFLFPLDAGMGNYFIYQLISIITSSPLILIGGLYLLLETIQGKLSISIFYIYLNVFLIFINYLIM